jgi:GLPGLI family protein
MKYNIIVTSVLLLIFLLTTSLISNPTPKEFQGKAYYFSKSTMSLGNFGARFSEAQKKQIMERLKGRLEKKYVLTFNRNESMFLEEEKLDAVSGATDSWGKNFTPGDQYKNTKDTTQIQNQEFYGKNFLVKDNLLALNWEMSAETKKIGNYICYKAVALVPSSDLTWYAFSWNQLPSNDAPKEGEEKAVKMTRVEAWYTPQLPVSHGPSEYWGLPGLILEVSAGDTTLLCYEIVINPKEKTTFKIPKKGKVVTKNEYQSIVFKKMKEFRDNRRGRR